MLYAFHNRASQQQLYTLGPYQLTSIFTCRFTIAIFTMLWYRESDTYTAYETCVAQQCGEVASLNHEPGWRVRRRWPQTRLQTQKEEPRGRYNVVMRWVEMDLVREV
jgi:hypothetical protein